MPLLDSLLSVLAPQKCLSCGDEGKLICGWCAPDAFTPLPSRCYRCKKLTADSAVCPSCRKQTALRHVWIRTDYAHMAKDLLHVYKFERAQSAAGLIARAMEGALPYVSANTLVVAIPTATGRTRQRGYDHSALLARRVARSRNLLHIPALSNLSQVRQVGSNRQKRLEQLQNNFIVTRLSLVRGADILLVDDVVTTGATLETAAKVLKQSGVKSINALTFAQKQ